MPPASIAAAVVERRLAVELEIDEAVEAAEGAQQDVLGDAVARCADVPMRAVLVLPGADQEHVAHLEPAGRRAPCRFQDHGARQVAAAGRTIRSSGPARNRPACRSRIAAKTLGPSTFGSDSHSTFPLGATSAQTSQSESSA